MPRFIVLARLLLVAVSAVAAVPLPVCGQEEILFNRDIRPLLSENCFHCHGPDENQRQAELRLDIRDDAVDYGAILPGDADQSVLVERIFSEDPDLRMPPPESHKKLTAAQKDLLRRWVAQGAEYQGHWAYESPVKPDVPPDVHPVDYLIEQRLRKAGLALSPEADRRTLIRRLSFDLVGLPPSPEDVEAFVADSSPDAYQQLVERLLASPHYGERMAIGWLDVVRFADTIGYHSDTPRNVWPYRDWVIRAFNQNKPFDDFTIEQLAGDLLPGSTEEQKVASCFNRLLLTTEEGGAQAKDYEARMLGDRVRAVGTVWLGQTLGCCQCHDHKFDPASQRDFYSLGAFFADIEEPIIGKREPGMLLATEEEKQELERLQQAAADLEEEFRAMTPELEAAQSQWEADVLSKAESVAQPLQKILDILKVTPDERDAAQKAAVTTQFQDATPLLADIRERATKAKKAATTFESQLPHCLVSRSSSTPRTVRILPRGNWMDESGPVVEPALPQYLPGSDTGDRSLTRLDLARWVVSPENPLTARVFVNRLWKQFFGTGISRTLDDFGSQGEWPTHLELLDWLASEFQESDWDVKHMVRTIVLSRAYRQSSAVSPELETRDPENRLLARQSRFRMDAELVRDNALVIASLLTPTIGGPSVKPYQPEGYWENLNFPVRTYEHSVGKDQYRRGLYTWWQRSFLHPSLLAFDAPTREECAADRSRSNIPQQALVLLNDPTYVEAARVFAARIVEEGGASDSERLEWAWQQALQRAPHKEERRIALELVNKHRGEFAEESDAAEALIQVGLAPQASSTDPAEIAAWTSVARVLLNLHESITRN